MSHRKAERLSAWLNMCILIGNSLLIAVLVIDPAKSCGQETNPSSVTWEESLPADVQANLLWAGDHEEGNLFDWEFDKNPDNNGGGVFNTGKEHEAIARVTQNAPFSGSYCVEATINNAFQSRLGKKAVRLMRWTDRPWDQGGKFFPETAYYGVWMRIDQQYSIQNPASANGGWWNVFQFKSKDTNGKSQPVWTLNVGNSAPGGQMNFYLYSKYNPPKSFSPRPLVPIPVGRWFHIEVLCQQSKDEQPNGRISVWQDGVLILQANNVTTVLDENLVWGVGNYTDHIVGGNKNGSATVFFDDATVGTMPTHAHAKKFLKTLDKKN